MCEFSWHTNNTIAMKMHRNESFTTMYLSWKIIYLWMSSGPPVTGIQWP